MTSEEKKSPKRLSLKLEHERDVLACIGKTGYGKSTWMKLYTEYHTRLFIYDPKHSYPNVHWVENVLEIEEIMNDPEIKMFRLGISSPDEVPFLAAQSMMAGNNLLVIEECATVFDKGQRSLPDSLKHIIFLGREGRVSIAMVAQRASYIPIDMRSQCSRIITFNQHEGSDVDWLNDFFSKEQTKNMSHLPKLVCYDYDGEKEGDQVVQYSIKEKLEEYIARQKALEKEETIAGKLEDFFDSD